MQPTLEAFVRALRGADVPVTIGESIDAAKAVAHVGYDDRQRLKDTLGLILAKTVDEKHRFDTCFELFFDRDAPAAFEADKPDDMAGDGPADGLPLADMLTEGDMAGLTAAMETAAAASGVAEIRFASQRGLLARRLLDAMGLRDLEAAIAQGQRGGQPGGMARAQMLERGRSYLLDEARAYVDRQYALYAAPASRSLREQFLADARLSAIPRHEFATMERVVRRLAKRIAAKHSRRHKQTKRGQLDVRHMLRRNVGHDGVPFDIVWKHRKRDRAKVVAICDVSRSVAAAAQFLLMFLYALHDVIADIHAFAFSDRLVEVGGILGEHAVEPAIEQVLKEIGFGVTDYGRALADFIDGWPGLIDRRTTVIIMGDGRSNDTNPRVDLLAEIAQRSKQLIWLNPEPRNFWGSGDSEMPRYAPHCRLARTCNTVKQLERTVDELLRAYD